MYNLLNLHKYACHSTSNQFFGCGHREGNLDIWQIPFKQSIYDFLKISHAKLSCDDFLILCYWFCIVCAVVGLIEAILEFVRVYSDEMYEPSTYWNRTYQNIPIEYQQKARHLGSIVNIITSFGLIYGFTNFREIFILPWIITNALVVGLEIFYWIVTGISSKNFKMNPIKSILFMAVRIVIALHVMLVIKESQI